ncbi:MAG: hypothetical protein JWL59_3632 [Chthoniobacteraceae bacterium]|nr:hypothetical protein [Chthoniobacteraceae bacterium]
MGACSKLDSAPPQAASEPVMEADPVVEKPAPLVQTESLPPTPPVAVATPAPNYFAPEGVYFLLAATSVETEDGIVGFKPGSEALKQANGKYRVGEHEIELRPDQLTNDLRIAGSLANADAAAQAAIRSSGQVGAAVERERQAATYKLSQSAAQPASRPVAVAPRAPVGASSSSAFSGTSSTLGKGALGATHSQVTDRKRLHKGTDGNWRYD